MVLSDVHIVAKRRTIHKKQRRKCAISMAATAYRWILALYEIITIHFSIFNTQ